MDMKEFLEAHHIEVRVQGEHHHATYGRLQVDCPFCSPRSSRFRLGISSTRANCWTCGPQRLIDTLVELTKESWTVCKKFAATQKVHIGRFEQPVRGKLVLPDCVTDFQPAHIEYLRSRGFHPSEIRNIWQVQGIGLAPRLPWRLFIPVIFDGKPVSWTTRKISNKGMNRYITAKPDEEIYSAKSMLYGEDYCQHRVMAVEGPLDVWSIGPGAVSTLGLTYTTAQVLRLSRYPLRYICFDNSPDAQKVARRLCNELAGFDGKTHNIQLDSKDPGEAKPKELKVLKKLLRA